MGIDYHANAILGVKVNSQKIPKDWKKKIREYEDIELDNEIEVHAWLEPTQDDLDQQWIVIVGVGTRSDSSRSWASPGFIKISDVSLARIKASLQEYLKPLKLWDESQFGIWAVLEIC